MNKTREQRLIEHLIKIVQWEAKLVETDECWKDNFPRLNQELYDEWIELQGERNELLEVVRVAMKTVEKQVPKGVYRAGEYGVSESCPHCKSEVRHAYSYCTICGQKLDWSGEQC